MINNRSLFFAIIGTCLSFGVFADPPKIWQSMVQLSESGDITVKPDGLAQFDFNNQAGVVEGNKNSTWYSQYRLQVKKKNGKIDKIFEMYPRLSFREDGVIHGQTLKDISITNQQFKDGSLVEVLDCSHAEVRSNYLMGTISSPVKKVSIECYMASKPMCEKMRNSMRRLSDGNSPKSLNELAAKVKDCQMNVLGNAVIALQEIDQAIGSSDRFNTMLNESRAELAKKYKSSGFTIAKPEIVFNHGEQAYNHLLVETGQVFQVLNNYIDLCQRFLPGEEGSLIKSSKDSKPKAVPR